MVPPYVSVDCSLFCLTIFNKKGKVIFQKIVYLFSRMRFSLILGPIARQHSIPLLSVIEEKTVKYST